MPWNFMFTHTWKCIRIVNTTTLFDKSLQYVKKKTERMWSKQIVQNCKQRTLIYLFTTLIVFLGFIYFTFAFSYSIGKKIINNAIDCTKQEDWASH